MEEFSHCAAPEVRGSPFFKREMTGNQTLSLHLNTVQCF